MAQVLVAEDDQAIRETIELVLLDAGHSVHTAADGAQALKLLRGTKDRLVVLVDHYMPRLDGIALLRAIAADPALARRHSYVLTTASPNTLTETDRSLLASLAAAILSKPFDIDALTEVVGRMALRLNSD